MIRYVLSITTQFSSYSVLDLTEEALQYVLEQYHAKADSFTLGGKYRSIKGVLELKIFEFESSKKVDEMIEIANKYGLIASFMAKINMNLPGCSGHVHQSLWDKEAAKNLFFDEKDYSNFSSPNRDYPCLYILFWIFSKVFNN